MILVAFHHPRFSEIYGNEITIRVRESEIHPDQSIVIYRASPEGMQNAARHGEPLSIRIRFERNGDALAFRLKTTAENLIQHH